MKLFANNKSYKQVTFNKEDDFEKEVAKNAKLLFGPNSIYIDAKRKIDAKNLGSSIPDGYLLNFTDLKRPEFYIVEIELAKHSFYSHIFPQITKFICFFKSPGERHDLAEKIFALINNDDQLKSEIRNYLGNDEIYRFLKDIIQKSTNILLIIDADKKELAQIMDVYSETWKEMVLPMVIRKFGEGNEEFFITEPEFENLELSEFEETNEEFSNINDNALVADIEYDEEFHMDGVSENVRNNYKELKAYVAGLNCGILINFAKYYVSFRKERNFAFFRFRRKKINLVVLCSQKEASKVVTTYPIKPLSESVQRYWNGPSCSIIIDDNGNLKEIKQLLDLLVIQETRIRA